MTQTKKDTIKTKEVSLPKFEKPNLQNLFANKLRPTFKPTARMGTINRSRR